MFLERLRAEFEYRAARRAIRRINDDRKRARLAANAALRPSGGFTAEFDRQSRADRNETIFLSVLTVVVLAAVLGVILAGCGGCYPLEPGPAASADAAPPPCAAPAGYVVIAHGCDCASDPLADDCGTETSQGYDHHALAACTLENGEHCIADCAECAP